jgi:pimeloyl-ACP methyl ester carboxylesterase
MLLDIAYLTLGSMGTLIGIICVIVFLKFRKTLTQNYRQLQDIPSKVYNSKHGKIEYLLTGKGPTILISHGITGGIDQGIGMSKDFLGEGYRFLFVSRFGYLKSSLPDNASPQFQADVYKELIDHLGIQRIFIFGNSAGSTSAINFAIKYSHKCEGLILLSSNAPLAKPTGHPPIFIFKSNFLYWIIMKLLGKSMLTMFVPKNIIKNLSKQKVNQIVEEIYFAALPITKRTKGIIFDLFVSNPSIYDNIAFNQINSPTLIINAIDDPATLIDGARTLSKKIKNSDLVTFETGGHLLLDHEAEIKNKIKKFADKYTLVEDRKT